MTEIAAPIPDRRVDLALLLLLVVAGLCVYMTWRLRGEVDYLHERVDALHLDGGRLRVVREPAARVQPRDDVAAPPPGPDAAQFTEHAAPAPAPERAATLPPEVITDPLLGVDTMGAAMPEASDVHPLLRSVIAAHRQEAPA